MVIVSMYFECSSSYNQKSSPKTLEGHKAFVPSLWEKLLYFSIQEMLN